MGIETEITKLSLGSEENVTSTNREPDKYCPTCGICGQRHWPLDPSCPGKKGVKARAKAEKQMGVAGDPGMGLKVVRRPVTLTVPSRIWDPRVNDGDGGWVDTGRPPANVTINMPVLASAQLTFDDKSIGQDFIPQLAGNQTQVDEYVNGGEVTPIGETAAQRQEVRQSGPSSA